MLDRDSFLKAGNDWEIKPVDVAELGQKIYVRTMGGRELHQWESRLSGYGDKQDAETIVLRLANLVASTACTENGTLLFTPDDIPALSEKRPSTLSKIATEAAILNGLADDPNGGQAKNSTGGLCAASGSTSLTESE